jgi:hypothetical protein
MLSNDPQRWHAGFSGELHGHASDVVACFHTYSKPSRLQDIENQAMTPICSAEEGMALEVIAPSQTTFVKKVASERKLCCPILNSSILSYSS